MLKIQIQGKMLETLGRSGGIYKRETELMFQKMTFHQGLGKPRNIVLTSREGEEQMNAKNKWMWPKIKGS